MADDQLPSLATGCLARDVRRPLRLGESQPRFDQEGSAGICQLNSAVCPIEEANAEFPLEATNLLTQWRLRDVQALRGATEVQLFRDSEEIAEMTKLHEWVISQSSHSALAKSIGPPGARSLRSVDKEDVPCAGPGYSSRCSRAGEMYRSCCRLSLGWRHLDILCDAWSARV
jgi:hypothetical protein